MSSAEAYFKSICEDLSSKRHTHIHFCSEVYTAFAESTRRLSYTTITKGYKQPVEMPVKETQYKEPKACELVTCGN